MRHARLSLALALLAISFGLSTMPAQAQPSDAFVAGQGSDRNTCTFARPCRTFQHVHDVVATGGVIDVLDPAEYGAVTITKSISIQGHGYARINVSPNATGISVNATNSTVSINGVLIEGINSGGTGIALNSSANLFINNCVVRNFINHGIAMKPPGDAKIVVSNTVAASNLQQGIFLQPTGGVLVTATFNRVEANGNGQHGIAIYGNQASGTIVSAVITESVVSSNGDSGIYTLGILGEGFTGAIVNHSTAWFNANFNGNYDLFADERSGMTVSESSLGGWGESTNGCIESYGNNSVNTSAPCGINKSLK
jgi:hypothetical protein